MSLPQSFFKRKMPAPSSEGAFDGQPQGLSLRHDIEFDLIATDNSYIFANFLGGSKPPPYHVVICTVSLATAFGCLSLTTQLLLFRKNHALFACSVVNALTTAHCRYQFLRLSVDLFHNPSELPTATHLPLHKGGKMRLYLRLCEFN